MLNVVLEMAMLLIEVLELRPLLDISEEVVDGVEAVDIDDLMVAELAAVDDETATALELDVIVDPNKELEATIGADDPDTEELVTAADEADAPLDTDDVEDPDEELGATSGVEAVNDTAALLKIGDEVCVESSKIELLTRELLTLRVDRDCINVDKPVICADGTAELDDTLLDTEGAWALVADATDCEEDCEEDCAFVCCPASELVELELDRREKEAVTVAVGRVDVCVFPLVVCVRPFVGTVKMLDCVDITVSSAFWLLMIELVSLSTTMLVLVGLEVVVVLYDISASLIDPTRQASHSAYLAVLVIVLTPVKIIVVWTVLPETDVK